MSTVRMDSVIAIDQMVGEDVEETGQLHEMLSEATAFLEQFGWCRGIKERYFGLGVGGIVAVFLFRIEPAPSVDEWLWVICGDLPSAYLVTDNAPDPTTTLERYCDLMEQWVRAVSMNGELNEVFPISVLPTKENATLLEKRVAFIRSQIIPAFR